MDPIDWDQAEDATAKALPKYIRQAEAGDFYADRRLRDIFSALVDSGRSPYPALLEYLSKHPLPPKRPPHRPPSPETERLREEIVWQIEVLRAKGATRLSAILQTSEQVHRSFDYVESIYKKHATHEIRHLAKLVSLISS
jgi:hypothetical protein